MYQTHPAKLVSLVDKLEKLESDLVEYQTRVIFAEAENKRLKTDLRETKFENRQLLAKRFFGTT